jgi:phosphoesterase RecJ-like protein
MNRSEEQMDEPNEQNESSKPGEPGESLSYGEALEVIAAAQTIAIVGHVNPDGDALGSALALRDLLGVMGKKVTNLLGQDHAAPQLYAFLPDYEFVYASEYAEVPDLLIVVDAPTAKRLGTAQRLVVEARDTLVVDHHANYEGFAHHYLGDTTAPAAASLVWQLIKASGHTPSLNMATYCYIGIMTDTGRFGFRNTNRTAFDDAAEMCGLGVNPSLLSEQVYENKIIPALRLEGLAVERAQFSCGGKVVYSYIRQDDLARLGLERDATEQLPSILRGIKGVEVAALFREEGTEGVRVNLRSRSSYDVGTFALLLGGGGHKGAAGLTLDMPLDDAISHIVNRLMNELPACD